MWRTTVVVVLNMVVADPGLPPVSKENTEDNGSVA